MRPEVCIYTQKSTRIWKLYLNYSKCTWKVSILFNISITRQWSLVQLARHSAVSAFTELFSSAASHSCLWDIAAAWLAAVLCVWGGGGVASCFEINVFYFTNLYKLLFWIIKHFPYKKKTYFMFPHAAQSHRSSCFWLH